MRAGLRQLRCLLAILLLSGLAASAVEFYVPPGESRTVYVPANNDWRSATAMKVTLAAEQAEPNGSFGVILVDKNEFWFQSNEQTALTPGVASAELSLRGPADWISANGLRRPFDRDVLRWVRRWGVEVANHSANKPLSGTIQLDLVEDDPIHHELSTLRYPAAPRANEIVEFTIEHLPFENLPASQPTIHWRGGGVSGQARFFQLQQYAEVKPPFGTARVSPVERVVWAARWVPPAPGTYELELHVDGSRFEPAGNLRPLVVAPPPPPEAAPEKSPATPFLRPPQRQSHRFQDGTWQQGMDPTPSWHAQLEWTSKWGAYLGTGGYDQLIAWRLEQAIRNHAGPTMPLLLFSDDELDNEGTFNWPENPLNRANGGPLSTAGEFYHNDAAMTAMLARARYLINRYAVFPAVEGLLIDLRHPATLGRQWATTLAERLKQEFPQTPIRLAHPLMQSRAWASTLSVGDSWRRSPQLETTLTQVQPDAGDRIRIQTSSPGVAATIAKKVEHLAHASALSFSIEPRGRFSNALRAMVLLKSVDGKICQSPLLPLAGEFAHTFEVPLDDLSYWRDADGNPALQDRRELAAMEEVAFRVFGKPGANIVLHLGELRLHGPHGNASEGPLLGPFDSAWREPVYAYKGKSWRDVAEPPTSCWNVILDWAKTTPATIGYGKTFHEGIAHEFGRVLNAHSGSPKPLLLFSEDELDDDSLYTWANHPLNAANGGPLQQRQDFYSDRLAIDAIAARARFFLKRFGDSPAINGLLIDLRYRHASSEGWAFRLAERVSQEFPGVPIYCNSPRLQRRTYWRPIRIATGWQQAPDLCIPASGQRTARAFVRQHPAPRRTPGKILTGSATLVTRGMTTAALANRYVMHWAQASQFSCTVTPSANCHDVRMTALLRTEDGRLFESPLIRTYGDFPHRVNLPLDDPDYWTPRGGDRKLIPALDLLNVHQVAFRFFNLPPGEAQITVADTSILGIRKVDAPKIAPFAISDLTANAEACEQYQRYELDFQLNRKFRNPYDPDEVAVDLYLIDPDGEKISHPGFYWEDWSVALNDGIENVIRGSKASWKVRLTPRKAGTYRWKLVARHGKLTAEETGSFQCTPGKGKGFVVVSKQDPRYFEFSNGDFYYPIGHNLRSPSDRREGAYSEDVLDNCAWAEKAGTYAFEKWFAKMAANGENFARIWTTAWWLGLEWSPKHPGYHGLGFYNQANARRLDRILQLAEEHGIYVNLELLNHGAISSKVDTEWELNPLNSAQPGGFMKTPIGTLTHPRADLLLKQRLRYVAARWGHSPAVALWGTVTEAEWADAYNGDRKGYWRWLNNYGEAIQEFNAAHPQAVTTHFSYPGRAGSIWKLKNLQVTHTNAYDTMRNTSWQKELFDRGHGIADRLFVFGKGLEEFEQPLLLGEWGGNHLENKTSHLYAELHTGLWASYMTNVSGASGFWWWNLVDHRDLYGRFKALSNFAEGEDRRGKYYRSLRGRVVTDWQPIGEEREMPPQALMLYNRSELFAYAYAAGVNRHKSSTYTTSRLDDKLPLIKSSALLLPGSMHEGEYTLEYWDTYSGQIIETRPITLTGDRRTVPLLPFSTDVAIKLKKK